MGLIFENRAGETFPHTSESWAETLEVAGLYGFDAPGEGVTDEEALALAEALERAVREDLGEHSVLADFAALLRCGGVVVEEG